MCVIWKKTFFSILILGSVFSNYVVLYGDINSMQQDDILPTKSAWLWSRDCLKILPFVVMQRIARVCQQQLSYLFNIPSLSALAVNLQ